MGATHLSYVIMKDRHEADQRGTAHVLDSRDNSLSTDE